MKELLMMSVRPLSKKKIKTTLDAEKKKKISFIILQNLGT
jgi:hypothetical protein